MSELSWRRPVTLQDVAAATGNGTQLAANDLGAMSVEITGTFSGTLTFEGSQDNSNWFPIPARNRSTDVSATTTTGTGLYEVDLRGIYQFRARISTYTSGNITVKAVAIPCLSPSPSSIATLSGALPAGNNNIGDVDIASLPNEGQQTMANSISVAVASDQSAVPVSGTVTSTPVTSSTANTPSIASAATALAANSSRKSWSIQNLGTNPLFVRFGAGASSSVFHFVLKAGLANDDGLAGLLTDDSWLGIVSIAGTSPRYTVSELT